MPGLAAAEHCNTFKFLGIGSNECVRTFSAAVNNEWIPTVHEQKERRERYKGG